MALQSNALTTRTRFKNFAGVTTSDDDTLIESLIMAITKFVEGYCTRQFVETAVSNEVYNGTGTTKLILEQSNISSSATFTLQYRSTISNEEQWKTVDSKDYFIHFEEGIVEYRAGFHEGIRNWRASYTHGFDFDNTDEGSPTTLESVGLGDLEYAVWELIKSAYKGRKQSTDVQRETVGDVTVEFRKTVMENPFIKEILDEYKLDV